MATMTPVNMGVESVSYLSTITETPADYPRAKINLTIGASIPSQVTALFKLDASDRLLMASVRPSLQNPAVTVPANYNKLFNDLVDASGTELGSNADDMRVLQSARALLLNMQSEFEAFNVSRNALIKA